MLEDRLERIVANIVRDAARKVIDASYCPAEPLWAGINLAQPPFAPQTERKILDHAESEELLTAMRQVVAGELAVGKETKSATHRMLKEFDEQLNV